MIQEATDRVLAKTKGAAKEIASSLEARIHSGQITVGDPLPTERALCEEFATSRPTVREAMLLLQGRGYVSLETGHRPRAAKPTLDGILTSAAGHISSLLGDAESGAHLEQMRQFIEAAAARIAAGKATSIQLHQIRSALERNQQDIDTDQFAESDIAFHRAVVAVVGNPIILRLHDMFVSTMLANRPARAKYGGSDQTSFDEHKAIFDAIVAGDAMSAAELTDQHLMRSYRSRLSGVATK
ncbi:FCD domain-containing protein [Aliiroseovarius sp. F47248L]|uniref:FCD domain-containing protein n=1 Tax=Aliiroseovarius sp. F47248L TaxID=2926420 RepID=UPI001FF44619|nr:FCD domain-containing protein [Aliiroseovarius sp. F47248L]